MRSGSSPWLLRTNRAATDGDGRMPWLYPSPGIQCRDDHPQKNKGGCSMHPDRVVLPGLLSGLPGDKAGIIEE